METITPNFVWTSDCAAWLTDALLRLNWSYRDLDEALGYGLSRGSYSRQVCQCGRMPSLEYKQRLMRWWNSKPQAKPPANLLSQIQAVAVPWLAARQGQHVVNRTYTRRQARVARKRLAKR